MAAANISSTGIVLEVLTKDNYLDWSVLVKNYLIGKDLWDNVVEGNLNLNHPDWKSKNGQALHAIQLSCGRYTLRKIRNFVTAQDAWNHLKTVFSEALKAADQHDIEQGGLQTHDIDINAMFHRAVKKGLWNEAIEYITSHGVDIISEKSTSSSKGWTSLHVAVDAGQYEIMKELVEMGALLTEKDSEGYTPFALAVESNYDIEIVEWMLNEGGNDLLTMKIKADDDDKGDIPVLLAATKGHKNMTIFLFSKTPWLTLLDNNCYYGAKLLSHCIHAEIFDVAATLLQHDDGIQIPLSYESHECMRPIHALAHMRTGFMVGIKLGYFEQKIFEVLKILLNREGKIITTESQESIATGITRLYRLKKDNYLVGEILRCFCKRIEKLSLESELHEWSVHDAMLQAAKYGIVEFIDLMRKANPDLLWAMDKNKRGIFAHAILNRQGQVFNLIYKIEGQNGLKTSIDKFGNNLLHLAAELSPSFHHRRGSNAALIMRRELLWFKAVERIVPPMYKQAKNLDGLRPRELFTKNHEQLLNEGRQLVKEMASSFTIVGTLIVAIMFAAAFTVPGGNDQNKGTPIFLGQKAFSAFIIFDALSLGASSSGVLIFLRILTSRYKEEDFLTTLPSKLIFGIYTISVSVACMTWAFCAALALMLNGYTSIMVITIACLALPFSLFSSGTSDLLMELAWHRL